MGIGIVHGNARWVGTTCAPSYKRILNLLRDILRARASIDCPLA